MIYTQSSFFYQKDECLQTRQKTPSGRIRSVTTYNPPFSHPDPARPTNKMQSYDGNGSRGEWMLLICGYFETFGRSVSDLTYIMKNDAYSSISWGESQRISDSDFCYHCDQGSKLYSDNEIFHWSLNNNSNNYWHFLILYFFMFLYGWSVLRLRFGLLILFTEI